MGHTAESVCQTLLGSAQLNSEDLVRLTEKHLTEPKTRTLVLGPNPLSPFGHITEGLVLFLQQRGVDADMIDPRSPVWNHHTKAQDFEYILALPLTIGPAAEVVDLMTNPELKPKIVVVVPQDYSSSYLVKLVRKTNMAGYQECGAITRNTVAVDLGTDCLWALVQHAGNRLEHAAEGDRLQGAGSQQGKLAAELERLLLAQEGPVDGASTDDEVPMASNDDASVALPAALKDDDRNAGTSFRSANDEHVSTLKVSPATLRAAIDDEGGPPGPPAATSYGSSGILKGLVGSVPVLLALSFPVAALITGGPIAAVLVLLLLLFAAAVVRVEYQMWQERGRRSGTTGMARFLDGVFRIYDNGAGYEGPTEVPDKENT